MARADVATEHAEGHPAQSGYAEAVHRLALAQKSNRGAPAYSRWVNRPLGRRLAAVAYVTGRTPNQVTVSSAVVTFTAIIALAAVPTRPWLGLVVGGLLAVGYALDAADGQLARLRGGGSVQGEWLDHVVDCVKNVSIHLAVLVAWYRFSEPRQDLLLLVPIVFAIQAVTWFFALILTEKLRPATNRAPDKTVPDSQRPPRLRSLLVLPADYGLLCVVFVLFGLGLAFPVLYTALAVANVGLLFAGLRKWFRELAPQAGGR